MVENGLNFEWNAGLEDKGYAMEAEDSLLIAGELVNASVCANNFSIDEAELPKLAEQVKSVTLRIDHGKSARDVIGGLREGTYDAKNKRVMFEAEVDDPQMQRMIKKGRLKFVSIGATADAFCSVCNKPTKPLRSCKCKNSHDVIRNIKLREASIVTEPAYQSAEFKPVSFSAALSSALAEQIVTPQVEARLSQENNKMEERKMTDDKKEVEATTLKPAGTDAVILLGQKLESLSAMVTKMEERFKKQDEDEAKKKAKEEDEAKKKKDEDECKKSEATITKFEQAVAGLTLKLEEFAKPKKEETSGGIPKDVPKSKFEEKKQPPPEEKKPPEEEEESKTKKETVRGARIEKTDETIIEATERMPWYKEIAAFAKEHGILD